MREYSTLPIMNMQKQTKKHSQKKSNRQPFQVNDRVCHEIK